MSTTTTTERTRHRRKPLPEPFRQSVERRGWGLDPWVVLPIPFIIGMIYGWATLPVVFVPTLVAYLALEALRGRRRAVQDKADRGA